MKAFLNNAWAWLRSDTPWAKAARCVFWGAVVCVPLALLSFFDKHAPLYIAWPGLKTYFRELGLAVACLWPVIVTSVYTPKSRRAPGGRELLAELLTSMAMVPVIVFLWGGVQLLVPYLLGATAFMAWRVFGIVELRLDIPSTSIPVAIDLPTPQKRPFTRNNLALALISPAIASLQYLCWIYLLVAWAKIARLHGLPNLFLTFEDISLYLPPGVGILAATMGQHFRRMFLPDKPKTVAACYALLIGALFLLVTPTFVQIEHWPEIFLVGVFIIAWFFKRYFTKPAPESPAVARPAGGGAVGGSFLGNLPADTTKGGRK